MLQPKIDLEKLEQILTKDEFEIAKGIVATRGKNKGCLRVSAPKIKSWREDNPSSRYGYDIVFDELQSHTAYVWRMVAFYIGKHHSHSCMPVTATFKLNVSWRTKEYDELIKWLDSIVDKVVETVPVEQWSGVSRWHKALGY